MIRSFPLAWLWPLIALAMWLSPSRSRAFEPVPDGLVILTFDDSVANHATFVEPLLKKLGSGATFFITEGFEFPTDKEHYMSWEQIAALNTEGFEIGNHTRSHTSVDQAKNLAEEIEFIEAQCLKYGIPRPTSFCYPGYASSPEAVQLLRRSGYLFARAGGSRAYEPLLDDPLVMPQAFDGKPDSTLETFKAAVAQAKNGKIAVMTFHGVPDINHPWVSSEPGKFETYMTILKQSGCRVISVRDLRQYVAPLALKPASCGGSD